MKRLLKLFVKKRGQINVSIIAVVAIIGIAVLLFVPAISLTLEGGDWSTIGAKEYLERQGYTVVIPIHGITTGNLMPNTDSVWDIGAPGQEFHEGHTDYTTLGGSLLGVTAIMDTFLDTLAADPVHYANNEDLSAGVPLTFGLAAQPDVPRTISVDFDTHANITAYTIDFVGVNAQGDAVSESKTEADLWDWETDHAYAKVTSITMSARTGTGVGDTMDIGITDVLGLSNNINAAADVYKIKENNADATIVAGDVDTTYNTYDMHTIGIGAADDYTIWYLGNISHID